jgi:hypothetical protein
MDMNAKDDIESRRIIDIAATSSKCFRKSELNLPILPLDLKRVAKASRTGLP